MQRPDIHLLVLAGTTSGLLQPMHSFPPASSRSKSCYFIKKAAEPVTKENFRNVLIFGDIGAKPVDELAVLVQEVLLHDSSSYYVMNSCKQENKDAYQRSTHIFQQHYFAFCSSVVLMFTSLLM
jgi:hypothetical protein